MKNFFDFKNEINKEDFLKIKEVILSDGIIVFPTETVYGIGASIYSEKAIKKIFVAKGRPNDNPLIVHISNYNCLKDIVTEVDDISKKLMDSFWPGPLTIILPKKKNISNTITANLDTVALRMPSNEIALKLIESCGVPIAAPSANISGKPSGTNIKDIFDELNERVDAIIDGGNTDVGIESTVVRVINNTVHILRPGKITKEDIMALGISVIDNGVDKKVKAKEKVISPGTKHKHYAPNAEAILVYSDDNEKLVKKINELENEFKNKKIIVLSSLENKDKYHNQTLIMGSKNNLLEISHNIFNVLRNADRLEPDLIIIEGVSNNHIGAAIMNRLIKACSYNYIKL